MSHRLPSMKLEGESRQESTQTSSRVWGPFEDHTIRGETNHVYERTRSKSECLEMLWERAFEPSPTHMLNGLRRLGGPRCGERCTAGVALLGIVVIVCNDERVIRVPRRAALALPVDVSVSDIPR